MLVRALLLRYQGVPIDRETLRDSVPLLGHLRYSIKTGNLLLMPVDGGTDPVVQLFRCRNLVAEKRGLVYQGIEDRWRRKAKESFPQALWCWPASPDPMTIRVVQPTTSVMDDLREAMR
jgi:hypothetical protein